MFPAMPAQVNEQMVDALELERSETRQERDEIVRSDQRQAEAITRALVHKQSPPPD